MKTRLFAMAVVASAFAVPAMAQVMAPGEYVAAAGASDLYERQSSQIVLETTASPAVKSFATMMLSAHARSTAEVKAAAINSRVEVAPPMLMPAQAEMIAQLKAETGAARDATYIAQQKGAHGQALSVQQAYAADGTAPALKTAAENIVSVVQDHIMMLMKM